MMRIKEYKKLIKLPPFSYDVEIIVTEDIVKSREKYNKILKKQFVSFGDEVIGGLHTYDIGNARSYLFLRTTSDSNTVAHECFHVIARLMNDHEVGLDDNTNEVFAYHLGALVGKVTDFLDDVKRRINDRD